MPNKDELKGKVREGMGTAREKTGELTGNRELQSKGETQKAQGKLESAWGKVKGAAEDATEAVREKTGR